MSESNASPTPGNGKPHVTDLVFLLSMVGLVILVALVGRMNFREGLKTEAAKSQAEVLVAWMKEAVIRRASADFQPTACGIRNGAATEPAHWRDCSRALFDEGGPLANARNGFSGELVKFVKRCNPSDRSTAGQIVIEKVTPTPPGSAVPFVVVPLEDDDKLGQKLTLRLAVCDKGGYAIGVGETDF